jgi:hypothetical protein
MTNEFLKLPLEIQVALAGGYLAYTVAYGGYGTKSTATEVAFRSLAFGLISVLAFRQTVLCGAGTWAAATVAITSAVLTGALWRRWIRRLVWRFLAWTGVSREDGIPTAWSAIIQSPNIYVTQLTVRTTDGRVLFHDRSCYDKALHDGLYLGSDGSIMMVICSETLADGTKRQSEDITSDGWGTRLTYIPANQIAQVNLRTPTLA